MARVFFLGAMGLSLGVLGCGGPPSENGPQEEAAARLGIPKQMSLDCRNGVNLKVLLIPAGTFQRGSPAEEPERQQNETQHTVTLGTAFYMGATEVTQQQYEAVMGSSRCNFEGAKNPVESVTWKDATEFCRKMSAKTGKAIRLPTEAEWEYACRAGTTTPFHFGETITTDQANYDGSSAYGNGPKGVWRRKTTPVGSFPANPWGLYDMHGNVSEWCQDWKGSYPSGAVTDPTGPASGAPRVERGGSWRADPAGLRSAHRGTFEPGDRVSNYVGFRIAFSASSAAD